MNTAARPATDGGGSHWYSLNCEPLYEVPKKDGSGMRPFTLADARKMTPRPVPSVTTVLKTLWKPQLEAWKIEQACLAVLTAPRGPAEGLDAFVERVLHEERQQDQERDVAARRGVAIHDAIEGWFNDQSCHQTLDMWRWIEPTIEFLVQHGGTRGCQTETILVSDDGYGGRVDLISEPPVDIRHHIWDFKSTRNLPKEAYPEHVLQCAAYANALQQSLGPARVPITTGNIYISTVNQGEFKVCLHGDWQDTYKRGFKPLLDYWQWANKWGEA